MVENFVFFIVGKNIEISCFIKAWFFDTETWFYGHIEKWKQILNP